MYTNYSELMKESRKLVSKIFDGWNKQGRAEFTKDYEQILKEVRTDINKILCEKYRIIFFNN